MDVMGREEVSRSKRLCEICLAHACILFFTLHASFYWVVLVSSEYVAGSKLWGPSAEVVSTLRQAITNYGIEPDIIGPNEVPEETEVDLDRTVRPIQKNWNRHTGRIGKEVPTVRKELCVSSLLFLEFSLMPSNTHQALPLTPSSRHDSIYRTDDYQCSDFPNPKVRTRGGLIAMHCSST
ncbi:hypothetical protein BDN71DRAFT_772986 [Pleurotus eryngii]|uniref:Uncharacterized protein n=1 Tax=Pleurotus eryngii TaxID=5323 RepID=A0A9P6A058_PLEER|nr:hypothetical protein BDN71DRAFT_772986 [Pleurotus eryngii]